MRRGLKPPELALTPKVIKTEVRRLQKMEILPVESSGWEDRGR
jgi:hypothetical protein